MSHHVSHIIELTESHRWKVSTNICRHQWHTERQKAEEKSKCSMGKEITACVLFVLSIAKVQLVPCFLLIFCTFLTLVLEYIYSSSFKLEALWHLALSHRRGVRWVRVSYLHHVQNLVLMTGKSTLGFETMNSRPTMTSFFSKEEEERLLLRPSSVPQL